MYPDSRILLRLGRRIGLLGLVRLGGSEDREVVAVEVHGVDLLAVLLEASLLQRAARHHQIAGLRIVADVCAGALAPDRDLVPVRSILGVAVAVLEGIVARIETRVVCPTSRTLPMRPRIWNSAKSLMAAKATPEPKRVRREAEAKQRTQRRRQFWIARNWRATPRGKLFASPRSVPIASFIATERRGRTSWLSAHPSRLERVNQGNADLANGFEGVQAARLICWSAVDFK